MKDNTRPQTVYDFPCTSCGSSMTFDPASGDLFCAYCKSHRAIDAPPREIKETLYDPDRDDVTAPDWAALGSYTLVCTSCGAEILTERRAQTAKCPFCNTPYVTAPVFSEKVIPPRALLPFTVTKEAAADAFAQWAKKRYLAPFGFVKSVRLGGDFCGVYLPAFTYDTDLFTVYRGEGGRRVTKTYTTRENGKTVTRTKTEIHWFPIHGHCEETLDDILVPAEKTVDARLFGKITPFSTKVMRPFDPAFLAGFTAERYSLGTQETFATARAEAERSIEASIRRNEGYDEYRFMTYDHDFTRVTVKHILLPVWFAAYTHKGKRYELLVNGETGKVAGKHPWSALKIAGLVLLGLCVTAFLIWFFMNS